MQQPSPALSSPSTGFFGPRASPLFTQTVDQPDPPTGDGSASSASLILASAAGSCASENEGPQAPPKQLAQAMDALSHALRLVAEIRLGSDILYEALQRSSSFKSSRPPSSPTSTQANSFVTRAGDAISASLDALRATGKKLDALGVMYGAQQRFEEKHPWGLHVPLICSDGAIVGYSWKRQIAGQAAASAVERTRLALKAFTEQKKRFFRHFGDLSEEGSNMVNGFLADKRMKYMSTDENASEQWKPENSSQSSPLLDLLKSWQGDVLGMNIFAYSRLEWAENKSTSMLRKKNLNSGIAGPSADTLASTSRPGLASSSIGKVSILEVTVPAVFKAIISLFPSGSTVPDAVSVFSADEVCNNAHLGSTSSHAVFRRVSECATSAMHNFLEASCSSGASPLNLLLHWLWTYRSLFSKPCSKCKRFLALDGPSDLLLPPVIRPARQILKLAASSSSLVMAEEWGDEKLVAYHLSCFSKEVC